MTFQIWQIALGVFTGTLPLLGLIVWNLIEAKSIRAELFQISPRFALRPMTNENGLPEWLRELGAKVDKLMEHTKLQQSVLDGILTALDRQVKDIDKLVAITDEHRQELDQHAERIRRLEP